VALPLAGAAVTRAGFVPAGGLADGTGADQSRPFGSQPGSSKGASSQPVSSAPVSSAAGSSRAVRTVQPIGPPRPTLVVAGCDPALPLLEAPLSLLDPPVAFAWWPCGSEEALGLAAEGLVHVAGAHLRGMSGDYNTSAARELLRQGAEVIGFCSWWEGLVLRPELAASVTSVADLLHAGLRLVNREPGAEAPRGHRPGGAGWIPDAGNRSSECGRRDCRRPGRCRSRQPAGGACLRPGLRAAGQRAIRPGDPCSMRRLA